MTSAKKNKIRLSIFVSLLSYIILSFVFSAPRLAEFSSVVDAILYMLSSYWIIKLMVVLATDIFIFVYKPQTLGISDVKAGHGQHGSQQFASDEEASHVYEKVPFGDEREPGFLVGTQGKNWLVDTSDTNLLLVAPPKMGKTRRNFIPTLEYNARVNENTDGRGAGMILMDVKGTLYNKAGPELQAKGYCTPVLDLRNVFRSYQFNILYRVNKEIDAWRTSVNEEDRVKHYGAAERFAKVAANAIIANVQAHGSNENQFFIDTARGMITGFILLVAIYAPPTARHIISVFELIVQCSAPESLPVPGAPQRTMIASLMEHINDRRIRNYVAPASSADIRTALNIFSSALSHLLKFVDAEIEQLICDQSPEFDAQRFIDQPTAIFLICPDENPTRHFLASLFVRSFTDELIELAETKYNETLPRKFLYFLDEFGNMPPIENATALFSAIRSRGGRVMCALQAYDQLRLNFTEHQAATIEKNCHVQMNSAVAPAADKDAKRISEMLGNETILTGSKSKTRGVTTTNTSLIGRPLMSPAQLVTMPIGTFVVQCVSQNPYKSYLPDYSEYLELATEFLHPAPIRKYTPVLVAAPRMITMNARGSRIEIQKGMFDVADEEW